MMLSDTYETIHPSCCGAPFAVAAQTLRRWKRDKNWWFCPHCGTRLYFPGETPEQREMRQLRAAAERNEQAAIQAREEADRRSRQYRRIRDRVKNGVCPCCERTFQNLARHMATEHPEFGDHDRLRHLRAAYGLSQVDLSEEIGVPASYISLYENERSVPEWGVGAIEDWIAVQGGA